MNILPIIQPLLIRRTVIDGSVKSIKSALSQAAKSGTEDKDGMVSEDVASIVQALQNLDSQGASDLMSSLSDEGLLDFLAELISDENLGLNKAEKGIFFNNLASKVNVGYLLAEVSNAFAKLDSKSGGIDDVEALAKAIAQHASSHTKIDYIAAIAPQATDKNSYTELSLFGGARVYFGDAEAFAIAHIFTSLNGHSSAVTDTLKLLSVEQLKAVMLAGIDMKQYFLNVVGPTAMLNTSLASKVLSVASGSDDTQLKATLFEVGAQMLDYVKHHTGDSFSFMVIGKSAAAEELTHGLTAVSYTHLTLPTTPYV